MKAVTVNYLTVLLKLLTQTPSVPMQKKITSVSSSILNSGLIKNSLSTKMGDHNNFLSPTQSEIKENLEDSPRQNIGLVY